MFQGGDSRISISMFPFPTLVTSERLIQTLRFFQTFAANYVEVNQSKK
jgi:hypothetical protein